MTDLTLILRASARDLTPSQAAAWAAAIEPHLGDINTPHRIAAFVGQCAVESGYFSTTSENLRYTRAERICAVWPSRFATPADAAPFVNNPEALANNVYANRMGNGPPESGDGWRFRGLGLIQVTGREEYAAFASSIGQSVDDAAAYAATPEGAAASAVWFWGWKRLNDLADAWMLTAITRRVNGGLTGLADRIRACNAALAALQDAAGTGPG